MSTYEFFCDLKCSVSDKFFFKKKNVRYLINRGNSATVIGFLCEINPCDLVHSLRDVET